MLITNIFNWFSFQIIIIITSCLAWRKETSWDLVNVEYFSFTNFSFSEKF